MKNYRLNKSQFIRKPIDEVFSFFSNPENLEKLTPKYLKFKIITPLPIIMDKGQTIEYTIKLRGFSMRWSSIISLYNPPYSFIDEQVMGPYSKWHHTHKFTEIDDGTLIEDDVIYRIPLGWIGKLANYIFVKNDLEKIFQYRKEKIIKIFSINS